MNETSYLWLITEQMKLFTNWTVQGGWGVGWQGNNKFDPQMGFTHNYLLKWYYIFYEWNICSLAPRILPNTLFHATLSFPFSWSIRELWLFGPNCWLNCSPHYWSERKFISNCCYFNQTSNLKMNTASNCHFTTFFSYCFCCYLFQCI